MTIVFSLQSTVKKYVLSRCVLYRAGLTVFLLLFSVAVLALGIRIIRKRLLSAIRPPVAALHFKLYYPFWSQLYLLYYNCYIVIDGIIQHLLQLAAEYLANVYILLSTPLKQWQNFLVLRRIITNVCYYVIPR